MKNWTEGELPRILAIDASVNNVGWSALNLNRRSREKAWRWGTFHLEGMNFAMRVVDLRDCINREVGAFDILITEQPAFYSSEKGKIAARSNYTIDLAAVNWFTAGWFHMDHRHHYPITASVWKGMVHKDVTQRRFFRRWPKESLQSIDEHGIDATMMLDFWIRTVAPQLPRGLFPPPSAYQHLL